MSYQILVSHTQIIREHKLKKKSLDMIIVWSILLLKAIVCIWNVFLSILTIIINNILAKWIKIVVELWYKTKKKGHCFLRFIQIWNK